VGEPPTEVGGTRQRRRCRRAVHDTPHGSSLAKPTDGRPA
jgi:hypothetical protein